MIGDPVTWGTFALAIWPLWVCYAVILTIAVAEWLAHR